MCEVCDMCGEEIKVCVMCVDREEVEGINKVRVRCVICVEGDKVRVRCVMCVERVVRCVMCGEEIRCV